MRICFSRSRNRFTIWSRVCRRYDRLEILIRSQSHHCATSLSGGVESRWQETRNGSVAFEPCAAINVVSRYFAILNSDTPRLRIDPALFLSRCVSLDLEIVPKSAWLFAFAAVRGEAAILHKGCALEPALDRLEAFCTGAAHLVGHKILRHDQPHLIANRARLAALGWGGACGYALTEPFGLSARSLSSSGQALARRTAAGRACQRSRAGCTADVAGAGRSDRGLCRTGPRRVGCAAGLLR
jgi:hypothetical protein